MEGVSFPKSLLDDEQTEPVKTTVIPNDGKQITKNLNSPVVEKKDISISSFPQEFIKNTFPLVFSPADEKWFLGLS